MMAYDFSAPTFSTTNTTKVSISGSEFSRGMFVSAGQTGGLPNLSRIDHKLLVNDSVYRHCRDLVC